MSTTTTEPRASALPIPATPLVDRERDAAELCDLLIKPEIRLVTITGPGGVGKTRLALHVGRNLTDHFVDGVDFVRLEAVRDPELVLPTIAQAIGVRERGPGSLLAELATALADRHRLLILDNLEQLAAAPGFAVFSQAAGAFLERVPGVKLLLTSRTPVGLYGERELPLAPLPVPPTTGAVHLQSLLDNPAIRLFVERAVEVSPGFAVTAENAAAVTEICRRLDGLPLAIELAAARVKLLPPAALLARLAKQLQLLTGGPRDRPARQQTMRDAIAWSHDLLQPDEQVLFRRLGAFSGGFTLDAAEQAIEDESSPMVLDGVAALVDQSLLRRLDDDLDETRFGMLHMVEEFARERLEASGEAPAVRAAHAAWVAELAARAASGMIGPDQLHWFARLDVEHGNIRAALEWTLGAGEVELAQRIAGPLWRFWWVRGHPAEGRQWLERTLAADVEARPTATRANALLGAGMLAEDQGDYDRCAELYRSSLEAARAAGDRSLEAQSVNALANVAHDQSRYDEAVPLHNEAYRLFTEIGDRRGAAGSLHNLGTVYYYRGDLTTAKELYERSLRELQAIGDVRSAGMILGHLGSIARASGDLERAVTLSEQSLDAARSFGDEVGIGAILLNLGEALSEAGAIDQATSRFNEARQAFERTGSKRGMAKAGVLLASVEAAHGELTAACRRLVPALDVFWESSDLRSALETLEITADVAVGLDQSQTAVRLLAASDALQQSLGIEFSEAELAKRRERIERARLAAGDDAFAREWANGLAQDETATREDVRALLGIADAREEPAASEHPSGLKPREVRVLTLLAAGKTYPEVAAELRIGLSEVTTTVGSLYAKLGVDSRAGLTASAFKLGLV